MESTAPAAVLYVDPSCPFAWMADRWLTEAETLGAVDFEVRLLSLGVINEGRDVDPEYRTAIETGWMPSRVMAAVAAEHGNEAARRFYEAFAERLQITNGGDPDADRLAMSADALADAGLPAQLIDAATDTDLDDELRRLTRAALDLVGLDVGTPLISMDGVAASGPVLTGVPRGDHALDLLAAVRGACRVRDFVRIERRFEGPLDVGG